MTYRDISNCDRVSNTNKGLTRTPVVGSHPKSLLINHRCSLNIVDDIVWGRSRVFCHVPKRGGERRIRWNRVGFYGADIDDKDHNGSRDAVWSLVQALAVPPSVVVQSGGGLHLYFFLNAEYPADEIAEMNERIAKKCGGDSCHDKARILRLPTSFHQKKPENVQFVRFVEYDESIEYTLDDLAELFPPCGEIENHQNPENRTYSHTKTTRRNPSADG